MTIHPRKTEGLNLAAIRDRLAGQSGPRYWRSLEELARTEEFEEFLHREFPDQASEWTDATSRRTFLRLMGASLALAGVSGCSHQPGEKIVPYVRAPEEIVPGKPLHFATAVSLGGFAIGVLAESHMGRPTMVEGNERHPASLGSIDPLAQASVLTLYDPDRSQVVVSGGEISTWDFFLTHTIAALDAQRPRKGAGLRILTETVTSPTLARQLRKLLGEFPAAHWHQFEPAGRDNARAGARLAFGEDVEARYHFDRANVILALEADFLAIGPGHLRYAREFAARRETTSAPPGMNRLYVVESTPSITGAMADHRLPLPSRRVAHIAHDVARGLGLGVAPATDAPLSGAQGRWVEALVRDLRKNEEASLVVAGESQPPAVHALAHAMNQALGNVGKAVTYTAPVEAEPVDQAGSLRELAGAMAAGQVDLLVILGGNPAYTAPADLGFAQALSKVRHSVHLSLYDDETSALCRWHVPEAHELESWGDVRAFDGTVTIRQPLIAPLYGGRSSHELVAALLRDPNRSGYDIVRETWKGQKKDDQFETDWRTAVHDGLIAGTALPAREVTSKADVASLRLPEAPATSGPGSLEIVFRPDPTVWDGRFANNGWLQELPKPLTKLTWDNAALVSPRTAERLGLRTEDLVDLRYRTRTLRAAVWVMPGHADDSVTLHLGYGRTRAGRVGTGAGSNAYALRTSDAPWSGAGLTIAKTGRTYPLASTQMHRNVTDPSVSPDRKRNIEGRAEEERGLVRVATLGDFLKDPHFAHKHEHADWPKSDFSLYPEIQGSTSRLTEAVPGQGPPQGYAWGMVVNLNTCIGCNACMTACQAENNIPVVGKDQVRNGREMHWIEVNRYYHGVRLDNPETYHQPRLCMHCENAPCELVCPVAATVHDVDGLNTMVYNRCVGTRYCSNNCPYKVRHFNFLQFSDWTTPSLKLLNNPDVTVRAHGVMEKCTYCVQRINAARYAAEAEDRRIGDGQVVTACEAACPTRAIVFGDINDPNSRVSKLKADPRNYGMLAELNTRPRTTYIARLRNPNPDIETEPSHGA